MCEKECKNCPDFQYQKEPYRVYCLKAIRTANALNSSDFWNAHMDRIKPISCAYCVYDPETCCGYSLDAGGPCEMFRHA